MHRPGLASDLEQVAQGFIQLSSENLQCWRLQSLSGHIFFKTNVKNCNISQLFKKEYFILCSSAWRMWWLICKCLGQNLLMWLQQKYMAEFQRVFLELLPPRSEDYKASSYEHSVKICPRNWIWPSFTSWMPTSLLCEAPAIGSFLSLEFLWSMDRVWASAPVCFLCLLSSTWFWDLMVLSL